MLLKSCDIIGSVVRGVVYSLLFRNYAMIFPLFRLPEFPCSTCFLSFLLIFTFFQNLVFVQNNFLFLSSKQKHFVWFNFAILIIIYDFVAKILFLFWSLFRSVNLTLNFSTSYKDSHFIWYFVLCTSKKRKWTNICLLLKNCLNMSLSMFFTINELC